MFVIGVTVFFLFLWFLWAPENLGRDIGKVIKGIRKELNE